jgi:hypothetical protein
MNNPGPDWLRLPGLACWNGCSKIQDTNPQQTIADYRITAKLGEIAGYSIAAVSFAFGQGQHAHPSIVA